MKYPVKVVRPLRGGQITIPSEFREKLEIDEHTLLQITLTGRELRVRPVKVTEVEHDSAWARELYEIFAPVRKETAKYSEEEVDTDIAKAVAAVRRKRASRS